MFKIQTYGKSELALMYFPNAQTSKGALNNLNLWIDTKPGLRMQLREICISKKAHHYTPLEVELIVESIGVPNKYCDQ
ncbi:MAG: DUF4248 domain-containing protein [Bacteroidaceae bacterium]|nr:DUF4248 domain-containing protein [Bacteroidaceae bacterium]